QIKKSIINNVSAHSEYLVQDPILHDFDRNTIYTEHPKDPIFKVSYVEQAPIYIDDNFDFWNFSSSGDGTVNDPFIIDNYNITSSNNTLIHIQDTTAYFKISNNWLNGTGGNEVGIQLNNVVHGNITTNSISNTNLSAINLLLSWNNTLFNNTISSNSQGIYLSSSFNNTLFNNTLCNNAGSGIRLASSSGNTFLYNTICDNNGSGIFFDSSPNDYNFFTHNTISNNNAYGIILNSFRNTFSQNFISGNNIGIWFSSSTNGTLEGNDILNNNFDGIKSSSSVNNTILNNTVLDNGGSGILLVSSSNVVLSNEIAKSGSNGISLSSANHNILLNNSISNNTNSGISIFSSTNNTILDNDISYNGNDGIYLTTSANNNYLSVNTIFNNSDTGIVLTISNHNIISNNSISNNTNNGILLLSSSINNSILSNFIFNNSNNGLTIDVSINNSIISHNTIFDNDGNGISLSESNNNVISRNILVRNKKYGFSLDSFTNNNSVKRNDFIENNVGGTSQAYDSGLNNTFSNNFWDEWRKINPYPIDGKIKNFDYSPALMFNNEIVIHILTRPIVIFPNGEETLKGIITIQWENALDSFGYEITYSVFYSNNDGITWYKLTETLKETLYSWDTTFTIDGSEYLVKIVARSILASKDSSDRIFSINNGAQTMTTSDESDTGSRGLTPPDIIGYLALGTGIIAFVFITVIMIFKRIRKKE
ncbi:MAG: right-handed parallel beta-helix repeat-containing protein, partial [Candidatus Kariarchaeaceae archaeon]